MRIKTKMRVFLIIAVVVLFLAGMGIHFLRRSPQVLKAGAWASSSSLWSQMSDGDVLRVVNIQTDEDWRLLSLPEYESIIAELAKRRQVDVERGKLKKKRLLLDPWDRPYEIALRHDGTNKLHAIVWSAGPDGAHGTADDIVYPSDDSGKRPMPSRPMPYQRH